MEEDKTVPVKKTLTFKKLSAEEIASIDSQSKKEGVSDVKKGLQRRTERRYRQPGAQSREFRWSSIKEVLTRKRSEKLFFIEGEPADVSNVYDAIIQRYNVYDKDIRRAIDDAVFVMFDSEKSTVEDVREAADRIIDVCVKSDSVGVCSLLLEVNDVILFANEELGFVGETKVRKERRLQAYRVADRLIEKIRPRLLSFQR